MSPQQKSQQTTKPMSNGMGIAVYEQMKKMLPMRTLDYHTKPGPPIGVITSKEPQSSPRGCRVAIDVQKKPNGESSWDTFVKIELPWVL